MPTKRVHFSCDESTFDKLESLKHLLGKKRDEILEEAINDRFRDEIAKLATSEGLLKNNQILHLNRSICNGTSNPSVFDEICEKLNLKGNDGKSSSIQEIKIEVKSASVKQA